LVHFERVGVDIILPWCYSIQFWCVYTVTNQNWLTCTAIWNFPVMCTTVLCHTRNLSISIGAYHLH